MFQLFKGLSDEKEDLAIPREWTNLPGMGDFDYDVFIANVNVVWSVKDISSTEVIVDCDDRLAEGVPDAFSWIARIIWRIREEAGITRPFDLVISVKRFEEAYIEEKAPVFAGETRKSVTIHCDSLPEINPNGPTGKRPFDGGEPRSLYDDNQKWDMEYINSREVFVSRLRDTMSSFPFDATVSGGVVSEDNHSAERIQMLPGDLVTLRSKWETREASQSENAIVGIKVFNRDKEEIGYLMPYDEPREIHFENTYGKFDPRDLGFRELACLLPHVIAVVSTPTDSDKRAALKVRLSIDKSNASDDDIVAQALETMAQPYAKRTLLSKGPFVASDFEPWGCPVPDVSNPAPEGFDKPVGKRKQVCENVLTISGKSKDVLPAIKAMKENVLKHIKKAHEGNYYNEDELKAAKTFAELYAAMDTDIREYFAHALQAKPTASFIISGFRDVATNAVEEGDAVHWTIWVNTWFEPFTGDLEAFFESLKSGKYSVTFVSKCKADDKAQVISGLVNRNGADKTSFGAIAAASDYMSIADMRMRLNEMNEAGAVKDDDYKSKSMLHAFSEVLNNYAHTAFSEEQD